MKAAALKIVSKKHIQELITQQLTAAGVDLKPIGFMDIQATGLKQSVL